MKNISKGTISKGLKSSACSAWKQKCRTEVGIETSTENHAPRENVRFILNE